ncbi:MAG: hypothetical protein KC620_17830 [Myxococcales bacterium]|nr:hypothetical protein [Myxococcales bacterium]
MKRLPWLFLAMLVLVGCRDSPREVIERASTAAVGDDIVEMKTLFSVATVQRLERAWQLNGTPDAQGWQDLSERLTFDGAPLDVKNEDIVGDFARVDVQAGAFVRDYYLRQEDGHWRIELGAGLRYRREKAKATAEAAAEAKEDG